MAAEGLYRRFESLCREAPEAPAVVDVDGRRTFTRGGLARAVDRAAAPVRAAASAGRIVAVQARNGPEIIAAVLAAWREGLVPLPIDRERSREDVLHLLRRLGVTTVLRGAALEPERLEPERTSGPPPVPADAAVLKLTSGSSGEPRAVVVGVQALEAGIEQICSTMRITPDDRNLCTLPLAHSYAFDNVLGSLVTRGSPAVLVSDLVPRNLLSVIRSTGVTVWPAVPLLLDVLARSVPAAEVGLGALRLVISAGAPLPVATRESFAARFRLRPRTFYGATECGGIAFDRQGTADLPEGCVGTPLDGVRLEIVDVDGDVGRIRVHSRSVASATLPEGSDDIGCGTLLASDVGRIDAAGRLHLLGRVGEFVKIHGYKVHPVEVERVIRTIPGVLDVVVVPFARSNVSEGLRAVVVTSEALDRSAILHACERSLPSYKIPRSIEIRAELPRNERGKIDHRRL